MFVYLPKFFRLRFIKRPDFFPFTLGLGFDSFITGCLYLSPISLTLTFSLSKSISFNPPPKTSTLAAIAAFAAIALAIFPLSHLGAA